MYFRLVTDEQIMQRCLDLARNAWPECRPNPMVGAVLVHQGRIISEGFTSAYGGPHAEVNAIQGVDSGVLKECSLFVSLEPCAHHGKTPPCSDLIIEKGIPKVMIGCRDPFSQVNGKGIEKIRSAGIEVIEGILESACLELNRRFMTFHQKKRPYVVLKWAESADGYIDSLRIGGDATSISCAQTDQLVHAWRAEEQVILIGGETARKDDPSLTVRHVKGTDPQRFVWTSEDLDQDLELSRIGYNKLSYSAVDDLLDDLYSRGIQSVFVEGGRKVLQQFIDAGLYDEARRIIGAIEIGDGVEAPAIDGRPGRVVKSGADKIEFY